MSPGQTLRALVTARLAAAAEDIFELFERTILEYEEELCRCKEKRRQEEAQDEKRRQEEAQDEERRLEEARGTQTVSLSPGPGLNPETPLSQLVKEEPEELLPESGAEFRVECVKTEERLMKSSVCSSTEDWEDPFSCSAAHMETDGDYDQETETEGDFCDQETDTKGDVYDQIRLQQRLELTSQEQPQEMRPRNTSSCSGPPS
uniref:Uncharacterized protein n=1 Tax=Knipowitschia caucasica TaxID=637954 RepID=A0AAV2M5F7_KNICA